MHFQIHMTTVTQTHFHRPYQSRSLLLHPLPHDDHIDVHIYVDEFHECQVLLRADLGCTLSFAYEYAKSNPRPCASSMPSIQLHS
jgi:hypothetical protein